MQILFDNGTPAPLRYALKGHVVVKAIERGMDRLVNGELIAAADAAGFAVLLTTGKNMRYRQNLKGRKSRSWLSATAMAHFAQLCRKGCSGCECGHSGQLPRS